MSFSFKVEGSLNTILAEILEIEIKAKEEGIKDQVHITTDALFSAKPYIVITCDNDQKGKRLFDRVQKEVPRFLSM